VQESGVLLKVLPLKAGVAVAALLALGKLSVAATIEAQISFPGQPAPAMTAYVCEVETSRIRTVPLAPGQARFSLELPQGRYIVFLAPREPGAPDIYGAYTQDHGLAEIALPARNAHVAVTIDDWYLSDGVAAQLDHIRGIDITTAGEPLSAPRFSEYKAVPADGMPPAPRSETSPAPNFAGAYSLVTTRCGPGCERLSLLDGHGGKAGDPVGPGEIHGPLPCRNDEAVMFRRDSRLLQVSGLHADGVLTQYYVLHPDSGTLVLTAEYQRTPESFCATLPP
jgi:hypothetical protein